MARNTGRGESGPDSNCVGLFRVERTLHECQVKERSCSLKVYFRFRLVARRLTSTTAAGFEELASDPDKVRCSLWARRIFLGLFIFNEGM